MAGSVTQDNHVDADAGQTDSLIDKSCNMEMTRVEVVGNKSTSYDLLGSKAKKMELGSERSNAFVAMYRYVPHALVVLFLLVLALAFLFTYDYVKTRSEIQTLRDEINQLKLTHVENARTSQNTATTEQNNGRMYHEMLQKVHRESVEPLKKRLNDEALNSNNRQKEIMEFVETAVRNVSEKFDTLSERVNRLHSDLLAANNASQIDLETLKTESKSLQQRFANIVEKISTLETNGSETRDKLERSIQEIRDLEGRVHTQTISLHNAVKLANNSSIILIENTKQEMLSQLTNVSDDLKSQLSASRGKIAQLETDIKKVDATARNLTDTLAKDTEADKLANELAASLSGGDATGGSSSDDVSKRFKEDVRTLKSDVAQISTQVNDLKELRRLETDVNSLKSAVDEHTDNLDTLSRNVTKIDDVLNQQNDQLNRTNHRVEQLSESIDSQNARVDTLKGVVTKLVELKKNKPGSGS